MRALTFLAIVVLATGCDDGTDPGTDSGPAPVDAAPRRLCPTEGVPSPDELMGPCCWRVEQSGQTEAPELRMNYLEITEPIGSPLASMTLRRVLNESMQDESFNWLFRVDGAAADGAVTVVTGFGRRNADGTYNFSSGSADGDPDAWCPASIPATLSGETLMSEELDGALTVPVFDDAGVMLQVELVLRSMTIRNSTWTENRSCVGAKTNRPFTYTPGAELAAYIEVEGSRTQMINVPPVVTTVCAAVAGALDDATYCDTVPQAEWMIPPDSLCDASACRQNAAGMTDVCDPTSSAAGGCNAWHLVAGFAAGGVDIANGACP